MSRKYLVLFLVTATVVVLDQWSKFVVVRELTWRMDSLSTLGEQLQAMYSPPPPEGMDGLHFRAKGMLVLSPSFFRIRYAENPGAAWGLFRNQPENVRGPLFHVVSIVAIVLIIYYFRKLSWNDPAQRWVLWGLPLVLGGAIGNYIDRLARGFVVDFLEAHWYDKAAWPVFNLADAAICLGLGMMVLDSFLRREKKDSPAAVRS
ncbi:MAG TPA: signal peptidase II [Myxococcales bacterium]